MFEEGEGGQGPNNVCPAMKFEGEAFEAMFEGVVRPGRCLTSNKDQGGRRLRGGKV